MFRQKIDFLVEWKDKKGRKPLIIRGARQVGKSYLVREFARQNFSQFLEINFDERPELKDIFISNNPKKILNLLETHFNQKILPEQSLLFLDEIQSAPRVISGLRYFYEKMPELAVVCAGSLLDFTLSETDFSMPVGRVDYLFMGPMTFGEFLLALGHEGLKKYLDDYQLGDEVPQSFHNDLMELVRAYLLIGGMPAVVANYAEQRSYQATDVVKQNLLTSLHDDFGKYAKKVSVQRLKNVFYRTPRLIGQKIKYVQIDPHERAKDIAASLDMLCQARLCYRVCHSSASGLPLDAQINHKIFKLLFLDVGLASTMCEQQPAELFMSGDLLLINQGALCEQFIGQHLLFQMPPYRPPEIHFWMREAKSGSAEVDYVLSSAGRVVPIEVKAGKTGTLKSLHQFVSEKKVDLALRFNGDKPSVAEVETALPGTKKKFTFISLPLYLVEQGSKILKGM